MRLAPPFAALCLGLALTSSVAFGADRDPAPRAGILIAEGRAALEAGDAQTAIDAFEAALTVDPGYTPLLLALGEAALEEKLQGKAIAYYREALAREPRNFAAMEGEGRALLEKGALDKARSNLARLESLCGDNCAETRNLAMAIASAPQDAPVLAAGKRNAPPAATPQAPPASDN